MFAELVELGKRVRKRHDALKEEKCSLDIIIDKDGNYKELITCDRKLVSEYIPSTAKKGKSRLLLDNANYTLGYEASQHKEIYLEKLNQYKDLPDLSPIFSFYSKSNEVEKALTDFMAFPQKERTGNMTFFYEHDKIRPLSLEDVQKEIKSKMNDEKLKEEKCSWDIIIDEDGNYKGLSRHHCQLKSENIPSTTKEARFLLAKAEFTLGYGKQNLYLEKLNQYKDLSVLSPVLSFYSKPEEVKKALNAFNSLSKSKRTGNLTFMFKHNEIRPLSLECVQDAIKKKFDEKANSKKDNDVCSVCGKTDYPILDEPHGGVSLPGSDKSCSLVSYNKPAFLSYNLKGNLNSGICKNCARNYLEALTDLTKAEWLVNDNGKRYKKYEHAFELSDDTLVTFWTKEQDDNIDPFSDICQPTEERIRNLFLSIATGEYQRVNLEVENYFYSCTISSAAARIAVRDWMAISVSQYQKNLKQWFDDIATVKNGEIIYPGINSILNSCIKKKTDPKKSDAKAKARIGTILWHAALTNTSLPLMILQSVLTQIEHGYFSPEKSAVIRLVLNRNIKNTYYMNKELDEQNESKAYLCGRLFALICNLQFKAQGKVNSSIKDRFFASASQTPCRVMGILLTQHVPVYQKKTKGAYSKTITDIATRIGHFPDKLTLTERGEFALGYYYQYSAKLNENNKQSK